MASARWLIACLPVFLLSATSYLWVAIYSGGGSIGASALVGGRAIRHYHHIVPASQARWLTRIWTQPALAYALIVPSFVSKGSPRSG